ncbi:MAG: ROK family protein [Anaerolineales bacterium]
MSRVFAGIEAGGTKWVCMIASQPGDIRASTRFATTTPEETICRAIDFIETQAQQAGELSGIGIGSFGPLDLTQKSPTYGYITSTPKSGWAGTDLLSPFRKAFNLPVGFDTDVNAAALGEHRWGAAQGLTDFIYLTVGTGIGGAAVVNQRLVHGMIHPEMGHMNIPHDWDEDPFPGLCPYHGDCLEGLATGPAIRSRWQQPGEEIPPDHAAWVLEAKYLSLGITNLIVAFSPQSIILGGGVMNQAQLFPLIRTKVQELLGGYISAPLILEDIEQYIIPPGLGAQAGVLGAVALAQQAAEKGTFP